MPALLALPQGYGRCEVPLPRYDPISIKRIHPVPQPNLHELREPVYLIRRLKYCVLVVQDVEEPLGNLNELKRCMAAPACADRLAYLLLLNQKALFLQVLYYSLPRLGRRQSCILSGNVRHLPLFVYALLYWQFVLEYPLKVVFVSDGAYHHHSGPELGLDLFISHNFNLNVVYRRLQPLSDEMFVILILGMHCYQPARPQKLWTGRRDEHILSRLHIFELYVVQKGLSLGILHLRIRKCGPTAGTPVYRALPLVDIAFLIHFQKCPLGYPPVIVRIGLIIDARVHGMSEYLELPLHLPYVGICEVPAELYELVPVSIPHLYSVLLLNIDLYGHSVHIEAEREHHIVSSEPVVASCEIDVCVVDGVADVQASRCIPRRVVYRIGLFLGFRVKAVDFPLFPCVLPLLLNFFSGIL